MKRLFAICTLLLLLAAPIRAQEKINIAPPPAANASVAPATDADPESAKPLTGTAVSSDRQIIRTIPAEAGKQPQIDRNETAILNPETQEWEVSESTNPKRRRSLADLYLEGGYVWMTLITLCLIAMLFSAWKAPRWIKEFGLLACIIGLIYMMIGFYTVADLIQETGFPISFTLLCGGLRVAFIAPIYGMIVYAISLLLRIAVKPRI